MKTTRPRRTPPNTMQFINSIFEIKHSSEIVERQTRYLKDSEKCGIIEAKFGKITGKYVLYRGANATAYNVQYLNVEQFLCDLNGKRKANT